MKRLFSITLMAVVSTACAADTPPSASAAGCSVTIPDGGFVPPSTYPAEPSTSADGDVWFGSDGLFTVLPSDGAYRHRKSVWWSSRFPGGVEEEQPPVTVIWTNLGDPTETHTHSPGTNAYTAEDGWFMIAGIDPDEPGCWEVVATYKGATLTYVYERS
jgi:hypothetical protein